MYLLKICDPVRERVQRRQRESVHKGSGFIDSRWEVTINALVETNGLTIVIARLRKLFVLAQEADSTAPTLESFQAAIDADQWQEAEWWEVLFIEEVSITVTKGRKKVTTIERRKRDLSSTLTLDDMYEAYQGPHVLPQQDVLTTELDENSISIQDLRAAVAEADTAWRAARDKEAARGQTATTSKTR